jgi:hypothetical protein
VVESLCLVADAAGELDRLLAGAGTAWDISFSVESRSLSQDDALVELYQLGLGEGILVANLLAKFAENPWPTLACSQSIDEKGQDWRQLDSLLRNGSSLEAGGELVMLHADPRLEESLTSSCSDRNRSLGWVALRLVGDEGGW